MTATTESASREKNGLDWIITVSIAVLMVAAIAAGVLNKIGSPIFPWTGAVALVAFVILMIFEPPRNLYTLAVLAVIGYFVGYAAPTIL